MFINFLVLSLLSFLCHFYFHHLFLKHISKNYPDTFKRIDKPTIFTKYHIQRTDQYSVFMFDKQWKSLEDNYLEKMNLCRQGFLVISILLFITGVIVELDWKH
ncbi:MAG: hypothetical protein ACRBCI_09010 [Cellvibrionaceae bacterium]